MTAFWVQVVVFCFSGAILLVGLCIVVAKYTNNTAIITLFTSGVTVLIIAAVNPYEIIKIAYNEKGGLSIERHISLPKERKEILKITRDEPVKVDKKEKEKLVEAAKNRSD